MHDLVPILWDWRDTELGDHIDIKHGYTFKGKNIITIPTNDILLTPSNFHIGGGFKSNKFKYCNITTQRNIFLVKMTLL